MVITNIDKLREALQRGCVHFSFWKADGSLRNAYGTTNLSFIPVSCHPKGKRTPPQSQLCYFDLEKYAWRSCKTGNFECYITRKESA